MYMFLVYIRNYSISIDHHIYAYSQSTNITWFNELIVSLNIKSNIKNFSINDRKRQEKFVMTIWHVSQVVSLLIYFIDSFTT